MNIAGRGFDVLLTLVGGSAWLFAVYSIGARLLSPGAGAAIAAALLVAALVVGLRTRGQGLDLPLALLGVLAWAFAAFVIASRLISHPAGILLGVACLLSSGAYVLGSQLREQRLARLLAGECPRCRAPLAPEHRHRRWEPARAEWLDPATTWACAACGFGQDEAWACPACPEPV
jgi:hypothetical protein